MIPADCEAHENLDERAQQLYDEQRLRTLCWADRLFAWLLVGQWLAAIGTAIWISPLAWSGANRSIHVHVWEALFLGFGIIIVPVCRVLLRPGTLATRLTVSIGQALLSALLIHLTGGRIETHFHVFCSLALLAFYHDWRVLVSAVVVIGLDHFVRGFLWPQSVYGTLTASPWRSLEHAGWVAIEVAFLTYSIQFSLRETRALAVRQASLEAAHRTVEREVAKRTADQTRIRAILETSMDCIITLDARGKIVEFNPAAEGTFGYSVEEVLGRNLTELIILPSSGENHRLSLARYNATGMSTMLDGRIEITALRRDGSEFPVELSITPIKDAAGSMSFTGFLRDISGRKLAEQALQQTQSELELRVLQRTADLALANVSLRAEALETKRAEVALAKSEQKFRQLLEHAPDGMVIANEAGRIVLVNVQTERMFGYDRAALLGEPLEILIPERFRHGHPALVAKYFAQPGIRPMGEQAELFGRRKDGSEFPIRISLGTIETPEGLLASAAIRDVSQQKQAEQALELKDDQLRHSQKLEAVGSLAGGVAHEFNNLLQAIRGYTTYAQEGLLPDDRRYQDLQQVLAAAERATTLTRQLLGFGRRQMLQRVDVDFNQMVTDLGKMLRPLIGEHIGLELVLDENVGTIHADPASFQQVLMNLCINARDAMPGGGRLLIKTQDQILDESYCQLHSGAKPGRYVLLTVADTGAGMTPEVRKRIFEPFFTTKEVGKGTGLGLAMVYGIVQQHGGTIQVYSELSLGTTFKIHVPVVEQASIAQQNVRRSPAVGGVETILIAEDEPMVLELAARVLGQAGYRTLLATNGEEAARLFEEHADEISLALLDMMMPKLKGHEVLERIRLVKPEVRVIFCSGYDPETSQVGFVPEEGLQFIQKPFDPHELLHAVRDALDSSSVPHSSHVGAN